MKLLFDNNLSPSLVRFLETDFPDSIHCVDAGLQAASDAAVWEYARINSFTIVTKDSDFNTWVTLRGFPPHIVWIRRRNCSTREIELLLQRNVALLQAFGEQHDAGLLELL